MIHKGTLCKFSDLFTTEISCPNRFWKLLGVTELA